MVARGHAADLVVIFLNKTKANWQILFLLPNLRLSKAIGNDRIAIAPYIDQRIVDIVSTCSVAKCLVENFEDQFGRKVNPALLLIRDNAPDFIRNIETIVGFRNIFALSIIIEGHEHSLTSNFVAYPLYSDYFDFYPITISRNNDELIIHSPSVLGVNDKAQDFKGQTTLGLADPGSIVSPANDLFVQLEKVWKRRFISRRLGEWQTRALFRSLEMAYHATAMPFKNHSTLYDFGTSASLWVSAFEILSHPRKGKADLLSVLNLLGKYGWAQKQVARKVYKVKHKTGVLKVNIVQMLYKQLYETRNDFLHGNPVTLSRLHPFRNKKIHPITRFAPLIYKVALLAFLGQFKERPRKLDWQNVEMSKLLAEDGLCEAILKARNK